DTGVRQADIVQNRDQLVFGYLLVQILLDLVTQARCLLDPQPGARPYVQPHQTGVDGGKEVLAEKENQAHREHAECQETSGKQLAVFERGLQQLVIGSAEIIEALFEPALIASEESLGPGRL